MTAQLKQRIVGGIVLLAVLAIFLPIFFSESDHLTRVKKTPPPTPPMPKVQLQLPAQNQLISDHEQPLNAKAPQENSPQLSVKKYQPTPIQKQQSLKVVAPKMVKARTINNTNIQGQSSKSLTSSQRAWVLQLASFSNKANSERLVNKLQAKSFDAYALPKRLSSGAILYQVFIGHALGKGEAAQMKNHLNQAYKIKSLLRNYPSNNIVK